MGSDKSQVSRTLKILAEYGLVDRDPATRAYRLGWSLFALAAQAGDTQLLAAAEPVVKELGRTLGERTHLSVLQGTEVLTLLSESPEHAVQAAGWHPRVEICRVPGAHLQDVADVQPQERLDLLVPAHANVAHAPNLVPA